MPASFRRRTRPGASALGMSMNAPRGWTSLTGMPCRQNSSARNACCCRLYSRNRPTPIASTSSSPALAWYAVGTIGWVYFRSPSVAVANGVVANMFGLGAGGARGPLLESGLLAAAGLLDGRRATTNKMFFKEVAALGPNVDWVPEARWVEDGKYVTSSGVSAGIDMALAVIEVTIGPQASEQLAVGTEYEWHRDPAWDPFAKVHGLA